MEAAARPRSRLHRVLAVPKRWWRRSLAFRVVSLTLVFAAVILMLSGSLVLGQIRTAVIEGASHAAADRAHLVIAWLQDRVDAVPAGQQRAAVEALTLEIAESQNASGRFGVAVRTSAGETSAQVPESCLVVPEPLPPPGTVVSVDAPDCTLAGAPAVVVVGSLWANQELDLVWVTYGLASQQRDVDMMARALLLSSLVALPLIALSGWIVTKVLLGPIRQATANAERLAAGHLDERIRLTGSRETERLGRAMNHMASELSVKLNELEQLSRIQQRFVSDVSHELRTPLTTIRMATDMIVVSRESFDPITGRAVDLLSREVDRFEVLLSDLLEISRFDAGVESLVLDQVDLVELVAEEVTAQQTLSGAYGCVVRVDAPAPCVAEIDARRVSRIVSNLLTNAIEHCEARDVVAYVRANDTTVAVAVRDHGVGFESADAARVFDRFWRADPSRVRTVGGSGTGLAIALQNAELHEGRLEAWGAPGRGAHFRLLLPRQRGLVVDDRLWPLVPPDRD